VCAPAPSGSATNATRRSGVNPRCRDIGSSGDRVRRSGIATGGNRGAPSLENRARIGVRLERVSGVYPQGIAGDLAPKHVASTSYPTRRTPNGPRDHVPMDLRRQLQDALEGAYTLERELPRGGMSRVFVAQELALGRHVVIKVLAPELAATLSAERFKR